MIDKIKSLFGGSREQPSNSDVLHHLPPFNDLTPTDDADKDGIYSEALDYAFANKNILNIALSGPYGSGKSSIIKTYQKKSNLKFLNVSLAAFNETENEHTEQQLIEKSILQQMLYGERAQTLPQSRFKRIKTPKNVLLKSALFFIWGLCVFWLYKNIGSLLDFSYLSLSDGIPILIGKLLLTAFVVLISVFLIANIYKASFGMSLKKVSLKNAEIETGNENEESILNRHLDEILYFFQQTDYDVVIFEDLDRFKNTEIFVKLREINTIINGNKDVNRHLHFLYALKDDIFENKNRAKFFDFIVPVIPVINNTNSYDKLKDCIKGTEIEGRLNEEFLREVSLFLDDLRLIYNAVNELRVYYGVLKSEKLNVTKLFALIFYKNVYPADFEKLHYRKGAFYEVLEMRSELVARLAEEHLTEKQRLQDLSEASEKELIASLKELVLVYTGAIADHFPSNSVAGIIVDNVFHTLSAITEPDVFKTIASAKTISYTRNHGAHQQYRNGNVSFSEIENSVSKKHSFQDRLEFIENKSAAKRADLAKKIIEQEQEILHLNRLALHELTASFSDDLNAVIGNHDISNPALLLYLIGNGYLDESYHLYTSNFHEGRMTAHDRDFILSVRSFRPQDPNYKLDNPEESIATLRARDFDELHILNTSLVDFILSKPQQYENQINEVCNVILEKFDETDLFFQSFFQDAENVEVLVERLAHFGKPYSSAAIASKLSNEHIRAILEHLEPQVVASKFNETGELSRYIKDNFTSIFPKAEYTNNSLSSIAKLEVSFDSLTEISVHPNLLAFVLENNLFALNRENLAFLIYEHPNKIHSGEGHDAVAARPIDFDQANYSTLRNSGNQKALERVHQNIEQYVEQLILGNDDNTEEDEEAIIALVSNESIPLGLRENIIIKQSLEFNSIASLPSELKAFAINEAKAIVTWENVGNLVEDDDVDNTEFFQIISDEDNASELSTSKISNEIKDSAKSLSLQQLIVESDDVDLDAYTQLLNAFDLELTSFPENIESDKRQVLVQAGLVQLNTETFSEATGESEILIPLIVGNIEQFRANRSSYKIDDEELKLVALGSSGQLQFELFQDLPEDVLLSDREVRRALAGLVEIGSDISELPKAVAQIVFQHMTRTEDKLKALTKLIETWDWQDLLPIFETLPSDFKKITQAGKYPRLPNTQIVKQFVKALDRRNFISSFSDSFGSIRVNTFRRRK